MSNNKVTSLFFRAASSSDLPFVLASYKSETYVEQDYIPRDIHNQYREKLLTLLIHKGCNLRIICLSSDPDIFLGWTLYEKIQDKTLVHFVYIKRAFRKLGIAQGVLNYLNIDSKAPIYTTHVTRSLRNIVKASEHEFINLPDMLTDNPIIYKR